MRTTPQALPQVLRAKSMPGKVTMWVDHTPRGDVVYVLAEEMTGPQARALEGQLLAGHAKIDDIIDAAAGG